MCKRWLAAPLQLPDGTLAAAGPGNPAGVGGLARAGEPVPALRVRHVDGPGVPGRPVRALRGRRGGALRQPSARPGRCWRRSRSGWREVGLRLHPGQDPDRVLQGRQPARLAMSTRRSRSWGSRSAPAQRAARGREACSPSFLPAISKDALNKISAAGARLAAAPAHRPDLRTTSPGWINPIVRGLDAATTAGSTGRR